MKILHLRSSEFFGGPERAIIGQCKFLKTVTVTCASFVRPGKDSEFLKRCAETGVETFAISESFTGDFRAIGKIKKLIKNQAIDLLITHDYKANLYGYFATKSCGIPHIAHYRGRTTENQKVRLYNWLDDFMLKRIKTILAVSEQPKRTICALGIRPERVIVVANGFDTARVSTQNNRPSDKDSPFEMITAGRFSLEKGVDILIEALALIDSSAPPYKLYLYGEGPDQEKLQSLVNKYDLTNRVKFCGFVPDLLPIFAQMDFMVLPSRSEGMPNVVLEAWSQRLGVLATTVGGLPEMIDDKINGLLVESENPKALAEKIKHALDNRTKMIEFGEQGLKSLQEKYSFTRQAELLTDIYKNIVEEFGNNRN